MRLRIGIIGCALILQCVASWALYGVRISDLKKSPTPPNPIKVWGKVTSESPVKISDGSSEITVSGLAAKLGDYVVVTGNWSGVVLTVSGSVDANIGPARVQMIYITAGSFLMGNNGSEHYYEPTELPQHSVYLSGYYIGKYEVTRGEYKQFMDAGGYTDSSYWSTDGWSWKVSNNRKEPLYWAATQTWSSGHTFTQTDNHPVVGVSYYEAEAFCNWAGGHLPTEAQWERAARWTGTHANVYPWGDLWDKLKCNNWNDTLYPGYRTTPVGSYLSGVSPSGCQDMAGNVWEWCRDWYGGTYYSQSPANDPQGPAIGDSRVVRGGGWGDSGYGNRCAYRYQFGYPYGGNQAFGFRLAR